MANGNQIQFGVGFNVDKSGLDKVKASLQEIQKMSTKDLVGTEGMTDAIARLREIKGTAAEVEKALDRCFNTDLGTLNVSKFNKELKSLNLSRVYKDLSQCGVAGQSAFRSMTTEILTTNVQLKKSHELLNSMAVSMQNTVKWGITSSLMNNFTGSVQKAYGYVKDLDTSLNSIRIVSGQSADQMASFAIQANDAAKALGATTTAYSDAALIFYQQGDPADVVNAKTQATIKMANVLGENAAQVSDYMTAIWNNFDDGSQSLEHYGDVLTALGASTASSSEEIAEGLEKFAGVASTVGLSYEYATSALATVVAETRQSADTVGTAFKTLFARLQGLNLGETLDDGTTLNKYSAALDKAGISIKDQNGELKNMDTILDEMGSKWDTLNKDQQLALAQTVAGTRQYNQLVSLMDNWDVMNENLKTAADATGTLDEQQSIYMDSVEAHLKSMKASFEDVYDSMLSGDSVKTFADLIGGVADKFANWIDAVDGGGNALLTLGSIAAKVFSTQIATGITTVIQNMQAMKENSSQLAAQMELVAEFNIDPSKYDEATQQLVRMKEEQIQYRDIMSESQMNQSNAILKTTNDIRNQAEAWQDTLNKASDYINRVGELEGENQFDIGKDLGEHGDDIASILEKVQQEVDATKSEIDSYRNSIKDAASAAQVLRESGVDDEVDAQAAAYREAKAAIDTMAESIDNMGAASGATEPEIKKLQETVLKYRAALASGDDVGAMQIGQDLVSQYEQVTDQVQERIRQTSQTIQQESEGASGKFSEQLGKSNQAWNEFMANCKTVQITKSFVNLTASVGQLASAFMTLKNLGDIFNDRDLSTGEKIQKVLMALGTAIPMVAAGLGGLVTSIRTITTATGVAGATAATAGAEAGAGFTAGAAGATLFQAALGPIGWALLGITAAVAALTVAFIALDNAYNADANAAKRAAETAEAMAEAADKAKQEVKDLADSFNKYDNAVNKLESCTRGTQEWRDAVKEVNDEVLSLLDKYPQLLEMQGAVQRDKNGILSLSEDAQKTLTDQVNEKELTTQAASLATKAQASDAQLTSDLTDFGRQHTGTIGTGNGSYEWNPRNLIEENLDDLAGLTKTELSDKLRDILEEPAKNAGRLDSEFNNMIGELVDSQAEINKLATAAEGAANAWDTASEVVAGQKLGDEYGDAEAKIASEEYEKAYKESYKTWLKAGKNGIAVWSEYATNDSVKEIWDAYNAANGTDFVMDKNNGVLGTDGEREFQYLDNGEQKKVTLEQVAATIAANEALQSLGSSAENAEKALNDMDTKIDGIDFSEMSNTSSDELKTGMRDFIANKDFSGMDEGTFNDLKSKIGDPKDNASIEKYLDDIVGDGKDGKISDDTAKKYGFDTAEEMVKAVKTGITNQEAAFNDVGKDLVKSVKEGMKDLDLKDLTQKQQETIGDAMSTAFGNAGKDGMRVVSDIFGALDSSETDEFADALENIDWNTVDANTLASTLRDAGVDTAFATADLENLISVMQSTGEAAESLSERFKSIQDITKGLKTGDTISQEDYEKLGPGYEQFFRPMADGTYQLIEEANEFHRIVGEKSIAPFEQAIEEAQKKLDQMNSLSENGKEAIQGEAVTDNGIVDADKANSQVDFLESTESADAAQVEEWREAISKGGEEAKAVLNELSTQVDEHIGKFGTLEQEIANAEAEMYTNQSMLASTATSFEELNKMVDEGKITNAQAYTEAFKALYNTLDEDVDAEQLERVTDTLETMAEKSKDAQLGAEGLSEQLIDNKEAAEDVAESILRFDDAIKDVEDNYGGWMETLEKGDVEGTAEAVEGLRDAYSDLLDLDGSSLSDSFLTNAENLELMKQAANGSEEAYNSLVQAAAEDILVQCGMDTSQFEADKAWLDSVLVDGQAFPDIEIGANLNDEGFLNELSNMVNAAGMTAEQATDYLASMGVDAEVQAIENEEEEVNEYTGATATVTSESVKGTNPLTMTDATFDIPSIKYDPAPMEQKTKKKNKAFSLKVTSAKKSSGGGFKYKQASRGGGSAGSGSGGKKGGGGGGGGKAKEAKTVDRSKDIVDPYHDVNVELKKVQNNLDKISKKEKKMSGQKLFTEMLKESEQLEKQVDLINKKIKIAQTTDLNQKKGQLDEDAKDAGVKVKYNKDGTISNYASVMAQAQDNYNKAIDHYNSLDGESQEGYKETLDAAKKNYDAFKKSMESYETLINDSIPKLKQEAQDTIDKAFMKKIEAYRYKVKVTVELGDAKREIKDWIASVNKMDKDPLGQGKLAKDKFKTYLSRKSASKIAKEQEQYRTQENNIIDKKEKYTKNRQQAKDANKEIDAQEKALKKAEKALKKAEQTKSKKDDKKAKKQIKAAQKKLNAAKKKLDKANSEKDNLKEQVEKAESKLKGRSNESLDIEIKERQKKIDNLNKTIKKTNTVALEKQSEKDKKAVEKAKKELEKAKKAQKKAKKTTSKKDDKKANSRVNAANKALKDAQKKANKSKKELQENQKLAEKYAKDADLKKVEKLEKDKDKESKKVETAEKKLEKAEEDLQKAKKSGNKKAIKDAQEEVKTAQKKVEAEEKKLTKIKKQLATAESKVDKQAKKALQDQIEQLQAEQKRLAATKMKNSFNGQAADDFIHLLDTMEEAKLALDGKSARYGDNTKEALEDLQTQQKQLMQDTEDMQKLEEDAYTAWIDGIGNAIEAHNQTIHYYEYQNDLLEHNLNLIELIGGAEGTFKRLEQEEKVYSKKLGVDVKTIAQLKADTATYYKEYQQWDNEAKQWEAKAAEAKAKGDEKAAARAEANMKKAQAGAKQSLEAWEDTTQRINSKIESSFEDAKTLFETQVDKAVVYASERFSGGMGLESMTTEWETQKKIKDQYLDSVNSAYEITKLESKVRKGMNEAGSVAAQNKINKAMKEQLDILKKKDKLSQYEIDRANKVYELTLKQIALEDARNSKNTMKLKRDSQGNYTYEYASDNDKVADAQDEVNQAAQDLYNFDNEQADAMMEQALQTFQEGQEKYAEAVKAGNMKLANLLKDKYAQLVQGSIEQANIARDNVMLDTASSVSMIQDQIVPAFSGGGEGEDSTLGQMSSLFKGLSEDGISQLTALGECWYGGESTEGSSILENMDTETKEFIESVQTTLTTGLGNAMEFLAGDGMVAQIFNDMMNESKIAVDNFNLSVDAISRVAANGSAGLAEAQSKLAQLQTTTGDAEGSMWDFNDSVYDSSDALDAGLDSAFDFSNNLSELEAQNDATLSTVEDLTEGSIQQAEELDGVADAAGNTWDSMAELADGFESEFLPAIKETILAVQELIEALEELSNSSISVPEVTTKKKTSKKKKKKTSKKKKSKKSSKSKSSKSKSNNKSNKGKSSKSKKNSKSNKGKKNSKSNKKKKAASLDTGGYTGNWNSSEGKYALLHEKELVLNKQDTQKILNAVAIARNLQTDLDGKLNKALGQMSAQMANTFVQAQSSGATIEQKVEINADFSGVEKAAEIQEAFNNLMNIASQHAYNSKK